MYEKLKKKVTKEKREEIERIEGWEEYFARQKETLREISSLERLTRVALGEELPSPYDCEWYKHAWKGGSFVCHHPKSKHHCGTCPLEPYWIEWLQSCKEIGPSPTLEELCRFFEPDYYLRVIGRRRAQKEILRKLADQHFFILRGSWAREIILGTPYYHGDIDILVIENKWKEFRDTLEKEGFKIGTKRGGILARKGMVIIDIALITEEENHYIKDVYINDSFYGQFRFPKIGFEKRDSFTVESLELDWLSLGPERRTRKAKKLAKFLNQQKIKELDAKFSFEPAEEPYRKFPPSIPI